MEAVLFQEISDALKEKTNHLSLPIENASPIQKIVWSSFDYTAGPEMRFCWEANYTTNLGGKCSKLEERNYKLEADNNINDFYVELDNEAETVDGGVSTRSTNSSYSKNTGGSSSTQFEEIDAYNSEMFQLASEKFGKNEASISSINDGNDDYPPLFSSSIFSRAQSSTFVPDESVAGSSSNYFKISANELTPQKELPPTAFKYANSPTTIFETSNMKNNNFEPENDNGEMLEQEQQNQAHSSSSPSVAMITSCVDSGIATTISTDSNLSAFLLQEQKEQVSYRADPQSCDIQLQKMKVLSREKINEAQEVIEFDHDVCSDVTGVEDPPLAKAGTSQSTNSSFLASQIGCSSFYSSASFLNQSTSTTTSRGQQNSKINKIFQKEAELLNIEFSPGDSSGGWVEMSDEAFVAKHVLAEQIASVQLSSNPVLHKFCIIAARHISFGSFIFATRTDAQQFCASPNLAAFTVIFSSEKVEWYLERLPIFKEMFEDIIARFRPAHTVEPLDDLVCRCTREFSTLLSTFGALERWPLCRQVEITQIRIQQSHLWGLNAERMCSKNDFLARCITAALICRGRCAVVGSNSKEVHQLLMTLCAFVKQQDRLFSLKPYKLPYSPYLRLQAIKRTEVFQFFEQSANAHWPCSLLDIERGTVVYTGPYQKHRAQKIAAQHFQICFVFREAMDCGLDLPPAVLADMDRMFMNGGGQKEKNVLEVHAVKPEQSITNFLGLICLMPLNRAARISFVDHFHLRLENRARALITYVHDISKPRPNDKWSALSGRWSCRALRRNLNLLSDSAFAVSLAEAERLQPEIAEFIAQQTIASMGGRRLNH